MSGVRASLDSDVLCIGSRQRHGCIYTHLESICLLLFAFLFPTFYLNIVLGWFSLQRVLLMLPFVRYFCKAAQVHLAGFNFAVVQEKRKENPCQSKQSYAIRYAGCCTCTFSFGSCIRPTLALRIVPAMQLHR